jgi:hypothetical protein
MGFVPSTPASINDLGLIRGPQSIKSTRSLSIRYKRGTADTGPRLVVFTSLGHSQCAFGRCYAAQVHDSETLEVGDSWAQHETVRRTRKRGITVRQNPCRASRSSRRWECSGRALKSRLPNCTGYRPFHCRSSSSATACLGFACSNCSSTAIPSFERPALKWIFASVT